MCGHCGAIQTGHRFDYEITRECKFQGKSAVTHCVAVQLCHASCVVCPCLWASTLPRKLYGVSVLVCVYSATQVVWCVRVGVRLCRVRLWSIVCVCACVPVSRWAPWRTNQCCTIVQIVWKYLSRGWNSKPGAVLSRRTAPSNFFGRRQKYSLPPSPRAYQKTEFSAPSPRTYVTVDLDCFQSSK